MKNICFLTIICFVVAAIVPVSLAAGDQCTVLKDNQAECCNLKADADNKTLCQYIKCNGTDPGACYNKTEAHQCANVSATIDACIPPTTTVAPSSAAPPNTTVAPPNTTVAPPSPTPDSCTSITIQEDCCKNDTNCQYWICTGTGAIKGCYSNTTLVTDICTEADTDGTNQCNKPTSPTPAPESSTSNETTTAPTQAPSTCEGKDQTACCADGTTCQFVNCTDVNNETAVHKGCHSQDADLTQYCKNNTWTNACAPGPVTSTPAANATTAAPSGGAQPSKGDNHAQHFDAASFIGGIVLCAGLVAIVFFGLKFYKARTERNYHTLH